MAIIRILEPRFEESAHDDAACTTQLNMQVSKKLVEWLRSRPGVLSAELGINPRSGKIVIYYLLWTPCDAEVREVVASITKRLPKKPISTSSFK